MADSAEDIPQPIPPTRFAFNPPPAPRKDGGHKSPKRHSSKNRRELVISPGAHRSLERKRAPQRLHPSSNKREGVDHRNPPPVPSRAPAWTDEIHMARNRQPPAAPYTRAPVGVERGKEKRDEKGRSETDRERERDVDETSKIGTSATQLARFQREQEERKARGEEGHATRWARRNVEDDEPRGSGSGNAARGSERSKRGEILTPAKSVPERQGQESGAANISAQRGMESPRKSGNAQRAHSLTDKGLQESRSRNGNVSQKSDGSRENGSVRRTQSFVQRAMSAAAGAARSLKDKSGSAATYQVKKFENSRRERIEPAHSRDGQKSQRTVVADQEKSMKVGSREGPRSQKSAAFERERSMRPETQRRSTTGSLNAAKRAQSAVLEKVASETADRALAASLQAEEVQAAESEEKSRKTAQRLALAEEVNYMKRREAFGSLPHKTNSLPIAPIRASARSGPFSGIQRRQTVNVVPLEGELGGSVTSAKRQRSKSVSQAQSNRTDIRTPTSLAKQGEEQRSRAVSQNQSKAVNTTEIASPEQAEYRSKRTSQAPLKSSKSRSNTFSPDEGARMTSKDSVGSIKRVQSAPAQAPPTPSNVVTTNDSQRRRSNGNTRNAVKASRQEELERVEEDYVSEGEAAVKTELGRGFGDGRRTEMQGVRLRSEVENANAAASSPRYSVAASKAKTESNRGFADGRRSERQGVRPKSKAEPTHIVASNPRYSAAASRAKTELNRGFGDGRRTEMQGVRPKSEVERGREVSPSESGSSVKTVLNRGFGNGGRSIFEGVRAKSEVDKARGTR